MPSKASIFESGCGQGYLGAYLLKRGYEYFGVDISRAAILQARKRAGLKGYDTFQIGDVSDKIHLLPDESFDVAIDNQCFHMMVLDEHRKKHLAEIRRLLKPGGKAFFREGFRPEEIKAKITSLKDWDNFFHEDYSILHDRTAYVDGKPLTVKLPNIPARQNNEEGYRKEFNEAGFNVEYFKVEKEQCIIYAGVS